MRKKKVQLNASSSIKNIEVEILVTSSTPDTNGLVATYNTSDGKVNLERSNLGQYRRLDIGQVEMVAKALVLIANRAKLYTKMDIKKGTF